MGDGAPHMLPDSSRVCRFSAHVWYQRFSNRSIKADGMCEVDRRDIIFRDNSKSTCTHIGGEQMQFIFTR